MDDLLTIYKMILKIKKDPLQLNGENSIKKYSKMM